MKKPCKIALRPVDKAADSPIWSLKLGSLESLELFPKEQVRGKRLDHQITPRFLLAQKKLSSTLDMCVCWHLYSVPGFDNFKPQPGILLQPILSWGSLDPLASFRFTSRVYLCLASSKSSTWKEKALGFWKVLQNTSNSPDYINMSTWQGHSSCRSRLSIFLVPFFLSLQTLHLSPKGRSYPSVNAVV